MTLSLSHNSNKIMTEAGYQQELIQVDSKATLYVLFGARVFPNNVDISVTLQALNYSHIKNKRV